MNSIFDEYIQITSDRNYDVSKLYLVAKINCNCGLFVYNNFVCYLQKSTTGESNSISTSYVDFIPNNEVKSVVNDPSFEEGNYDLLILKESKDLKLIESFVNFCLIYANNPNMTFNEFIQAIVDLFQLPKQQNFLDCIGTLGELFVIKYFYNNYINICNFWHKNGVYSKYDFSFPRINIEVKTSISNNSIFKIKHDQIFNEEKNYLLLVDIAETDNGGESLEDIIYFFKSNSDFNQNLNFLLNLEKELKKNIDPEMFRRHFLLKNIYGFDSSKLSTITNIPLNISQISYDYDFDYDEALEKSELISLVKNNIK